MSSPLSPLPAPAQGLGPRLVATRPLTPLPTPEENPVPVGRPVLTALPTWTPTISPTPRGIPVKASITLLPTATSTPAMKEPDEKPIRLEIPSPAPARHRREMAPVVDIVHSPESPPSAPPVFSAPFSFSATAPPEEFTDEDLREALGPILRQVVENAMDGTTSTGGSGLDAELEPMLRATVRRALAEYSPASRPFRPPGTLDRFVWHLQALFTSRTYEDILFEKTQRFQVEEVFLVDAASLALVSFASCDPARHGSAKRVSSTVQRLALQIRDDTGRIRDSFELPEQRHALTRTGRHGVLIAVVRGTPNDLILSDLGFALRRIEDRFHEQFLQEGSPLLHQLQPFLEDCLLIQAPASSN